MVNYFMTAMESEGAMCTSTNTQQLLPKMEVNGKMSDKYTGLCTNVCFKSTYISICTTK